jgi:hypothetical protein
MKVHISLFRWLIGIPAATLLFAVISANSFAGALSGRDALSVTNSSTQLLSHVGGVNGGTAASVLPDATAGGEIGRGTMAQWASRFRIPEPDLWEVAEFGESATIHQKPQQFD